MLQCSQVSIYSDNGSGYDDEYDDSDDDHLRPPSLRPLRPSRSSLCLHVDDDDVDDDDGDDNYDYDYVEDDDDGDDDVDHDDDVDIYIMTECILSVSDEKVTTSWIVDDDDIYAAQVASALPLTAASWQRHQLKANHNFNACLLS